MLFDVIRTAIRKFNRKRYIDRCFKPLNDDLEHRIIVYYKKDNTNVLSVLCDKYGSDKGEALNGWHPYPWAAHAYTDFYWRLFDHSRNDVKRVFECGLGTTNLNIPSNMGVSGKP